MYTIVSATDFSENSQTALKYAYELSLKTNAELIVLHVYDVPSILSGPSDATTFGAIQRSVESKNLEKLKQFVEEHLDTNSVKLNIQLKVKENDSYIDGISDLVEEENADLLVLGTEGGSKLHEMLMGSTSYAAIKKVSCAVLTVPEEAKVSNWDQIVYLSDLDDDDIKSISELSLLASIFDAQVTVVHAVENNERNGFDKMEAFKRTLQQKINYPKLSFHSINGEDVYSGVNKYIKDHSVSLIVMLEREQNGLFQKWFHRDFVKRMEFHSTVPLLTYNENTLHASSTINSTIN
jgi:nucleotide-binding universal stress UspA family protein